jgi:hypothetical protein
MNGLGDRPTPPFVWRDAHSGNDGALRCANSILRDCYVLIQNQLFFHLPVASNFVDDGDSSLEF